MVGGEMYSEDVDVPRAVSLDYFNQACPEEDRYILSGNDVKQGLPWDPPAKMLFNALLEKVYATDARCIEIPRGTEQIFDYMYVFMLLAALLVSTMNFTVYSGQIVPLDYGPKYANLPYLLNFDGLLSSTRHTRPTSISLN